MVSILVHANAADRFEFLILSDGSLNAGHFSTIRKLGNCGIRIVRADRLVHQHMQMPRNTQWPAAVYYRLLLPFLCEADARIIYLDCDIIVRASLAGLWNLPLGQSMAGVADVGFDHLGRLAKQGIEIEGPYFNSGVTVWNLDRIRTCGYETLLRNASERLPNPEFPDQDWMNLMFESDRLILPPHWNAMSHLFSDQKKSMKPYTDDQVELARTNPKICHFTNVKPWTMSYTAHPYWFEYWQLLKETPYRRSVWKGYLKKTLLSNDEGFFFQTARPALKRLIARG